MKFRNPSSLIPSSTFSFSLIQILRQSTSSPSSSTPIHKLSKLLFSSNAEIIATNPTSNPQNSIKTQTFQQSISENRVLTQSIVIRTLLSLSNDPIFALEYYNWAEKNHGFASGSADPVGVLLHILVKSPENWKVAKKLLIRYTSNDSPLSGAVTVRRFVHCSKRFCFELNPRVFNYLLNNYITRRRYIDAIGCFRTMVNCGLVPWIPYMNDLFTALIEQKKLYQVENLFRHMVLGTEICDCSTVNLMMEACLKEGKVDEAEKYFMEAKGSGIKLNSYIYRTAIETACRKLDDDEASSLLREMKEKRLVLSASLYTLVILTFLKKMNVKEAIHLKDEMIKSGFPMNLRVANGLIKGCCRNGDLKTALELFEITKNELTPKEATYVIILEGCCRNGDMEKAKEIYMEMKHSDIQATISVINCLIKGCLGARLVDEATKLFETAVEANITNVDTYNSFISLFCREGRMDEAYRTWNKMIDKRVEPTVNVYNNMILGNCKKGNMDEAIELVSEMLRKKMKVDGVTCGILIKGYFDVHEGAKGIAMFDHLMSLGIVPTDFTFNVLVLGLCKFGRTDEVKDRIEKFVEMGFTPICV